MQEYGVGESFVSLCEGLYSAVEAWMGNSQGGLEWKRDSGKIAHCHHFCT